MPFHFKQWGDFNEHGIRVGKKKAGRLLDGREWNELPTTMLIGSADDEKGAIV